MPPGGESVAMVIIRGDARLWMDGGQWKWPGRIRFEDGSGDVDYFRSSAGCCIGDTAPLVVAVALPLARD